MEELFIYALKSAGILAVFVMIYHFLLRRLTFFHTNRLFLLLGMIASVTLPFIEITQTVYVERPVENIVFSESLMTPMAAVLESQPVVAPFDYTELLMYLYLAVVLFFIGKMMVELSSLYRLVISGKMKKSSGFVMVTLSRKLTPFSFFNYICYSNHDEHSADLPMIIEHEKVHAREWHSVDLLLTHLYRAVFWINPLAWLLKRQIGENLEFLADAQAKSQHSDSVNYERALLSSAASHMQPALANNFFTPFIKQRIAMLQKEASATWNAYKYALILPVMVVFIYSFNVVEEVEFVEVPVKEENQNTSNEIVLNEDTAVSEENSIAFKNPPTTDEDYGIYDISQSTTDEELNRYAAAINSRRSYSIKFDNLIFKKANLEQFDVWTKFNHHRNYKHNMTVEMGANSIYLLKDLNDKLQINNDEGNETFNLTSNGVIVEREDWTYGDALSSQNNSDKAIDLDNIEFSKGTTTFKIVKTSTDESLQEFKDQLKNNYNVDLKWRGLKRKRGIITAIKLELNDNMGTVIKKSQKDSDGIDDMCIIGTITNNEYDWSMNNCTNKITSKYGVILPDSMKLDSIHSLFNMQDIQMDSLQVKMLSKLKSIALDSLVNQTINTRSLLDSLNGSFQNVDEIKKQFSNTNRFIFFNEENGVDQLIQHKVMRYQEPLMIINGKVTDKSSLDTTDPKNIESMTVLKGKEAKALYGEKGKNGVLIITTKVDSSSVINESEKLKKRKEMMEQRRESIEELRDARKDKVEAIKEQREALLEQREAIKQQRIAEIDSIRKQRRAQLEERKEDLKKQKTYLIRNRDSAYMSSDDPSVIVQGYTASSDSIDFFLDDMTMEGFERLQADLEKAGHSFELITHKMRSGKLKKLKFNLNNSTSAINTNKGVKLVRITFNQNDNVPMVMMESY